MPATPATNSPVEPAPIAEWVAASSGRPSLQELLAILVTAVKAKPCLQLHRGQAICLRVLLETGAPAWRQHGNLRKKAKGPVELHHLAAPSSAIVASLCIRRLTLLGVVSAGQVVTTISSKVPNEVGGESRLTVQLMPLGKRAVQDAPLLEHKILEWYLQTMTAGGRKTSYRQYQNLLAVFRKKKKPMGSEPGMWSVSHAELEKQFSLLQANGQLPPKS